MVFQDCSLRSLHFKLDFFPQSASWDSFLATVLQEGCPNMYFRELLKAVTIESWQIRRIERKDSENWPVSV